MMEVKFNGRGLIEAYARLKKLPLWKVVFHASKDYVQAAHKATPTAKIKKSPYFRVTRYATEFGTTKTGKQSKKLVIAKQGGRKVQLGKSWYITEAQLNGSDLKSGDNLKKGGLWVRRVPVRAGWSKATWITAMRAFGFNKSASKVNRFAEGKSEVIPHDAPSTPSMTVSAEFHIDNFGRSSTRPQYDSIAAAGFMLAAKRITKDIRDTLKGAWDGKVESLP